MDQVGNPYAAPRAAVGEDEFEEEFQAVRLFSTAGRVGRVRYLGYLGASYLLVMLVVGIGVAMMAGTGMRSVTPGLVILGVAYVAMVVFAIFIAIQRCHDCDNSGWLVLLMLVPFINLIMILYLIFMPGTQGRNRFGAPTPPNGIGVTLLACIFPAFFVIGIVAAIALPAFQHRTGGHRLESK
ncbi:MAG TPA: DUF805 domain-containing protein [Burkholderiales bacterium]|jgi:uncharacterized membrane protein YhaH (DUF805 family)